MKRRIAAGFRGAAFLLTLVLVTASCFAFSVFAEDWEDWEDWDGDAEGAFFPENDPDWDGTVSVTVNGVEWDGTVPDPVVVPELVGTWNYYEESIDFEIEWIFNEDGTGNYYFNGMNMPIASYVASTEPYTQYEEDGYLLTVYWGEIVMTFGEESITMEMGPMEYGYVVDGDTLRITYSRDMANDYYDFVRK